MICFAQSKDSPRPSFIARYYLVLRYSIECRLDIRQRVGDSSGLMHAVRNQSTIQPFIPYVMMLTGANIAFRQPARLCRSSLQYCQVNTIHVSLASNCLPVVIV